MSLADRQAEIALEDRTLRRVQRAAQRFAAVVAEAQELVLVWRLGDGYGGWVLAEVERALATRGLTGKGYEWTARSDVEHLSDRDGWDCHYCGCSLGWGHPSVTPPQVDHKVSRANGGGEGLDNKVLACGPCNGTKGARDHDEFCQWCEL